MIDRHLPDQRRVPRVCRSSMRVESRRSSWLAWLILAVIILAVFGVVAVRTEGAREMIEARLQHLTGLQAAVGASRIGWPYDLVLENVALSESGTPADAVPLAHLAELRGGWRGRRGWLVNVRGGRVTLTDCPAGRPQRWAALSDVEDAGGVTAWLNSVLGAAVLFRCEQFDVAWIDERGRIVSRAENVALMSVPLRVPRREWRFFELSADRILRADGQWLTALRHDWLVSGEAALIQLGYRATVETPGLSGHNRGHPETP